MSSSVQFPADSSPIAVSMGEPAGVGPDIILAAHKNRGALGLPDFIVFGDPATFEARAHEIGDPVRVVTQDQPDAIEPGALNIVPIAVDAPVVPGELDSRNGQAVVTAIEQAVEAVHYRKASALVTAPIHKSVLYDCGFSFPGHTEFLGALSQRLWVGTVPAHPVMMLAGPDLRTVPVTIHIPLEQVATKLTTAMIDETVTIVVRDLRARFGLSNPRVAIAGLNPHAGENGALGHQDDAVIRPAVETLSARGLQVRGPLPADTMFHPDARAEYDVAICMYHDQALIPAKLLAFHEAVNVTLGLPFVRTSPDHGTALDLAGTGHARADSFMAALRLADQMARHQTKAAA